MAKNLKAENLTISVPNHGCNKNCPYCVAKMTGYIESDWAMMCRNIPKVKTVARSAEITSVMITGKGEPLFNLDSFDQTRLLIDTFRGWPVELQTNGITLNKEPQKLDILRVHGLDVLAVSMDNPKQFEKYKNIWDRANNLKMVTRITVNITNKIRDFSFNDYIEYCIDNNINQLTFRKIVMPEIVVATGLKAAEWITENVVPLLYNDIIGQAKKYIITEGRLIRTLNNGVQIWDVNDISFSYSDYCIQERDDGDNLRSLVFMEDGHLYTGWGSKAAILF